MIFFLNKTFSMGLVIFIELYSIIIIFILNIFLQSLCVSFSAPILTCIRPKNLRELFIHDSISFSRATCLCSTVSGNLNFMMPNQ